MCVHCASGSIYKIPVNYQLSINDKNYKQSEAERVHQNCMIILHSEAFSIGSDGELTGYSWINFPMRLWTSFQSDDIESKIVQKITDTFKYILSINTEDELDVGNWDTIHNTAFTANQKMLMSYALLANKVIERISKDRFPELFMLAHRILHERSMFITVVDAKGTSKEIANIAKHAAGTVYEATTLWAKAF